MIYINMATIGLAPFAMTCSNFVLSGGGFVICLDVLCALGVLKLSGDHRVKALTGPADHCRHDPNDNRPWLLVCQLKRTQLRHKSSHPDNFEIGSSIFSCLV